MLYKSLSLICLVASLSMAGCVTSRFDTSWPEPRPLGKSLEAYRPPQEHLTSDSDPAHEGFPTGAITLRQALALALKSNPDLAAFSWEVRAKEAATLQAGLFPNPELEVEVEEFGGSGERSSFNGAATTLQISQLIELGGKISSRTEVASLETELGGWDYESKRLAVFTETTKAFVDVLAAQRRLEVSEDFHELAKEVFRAVSERVLAGKVSPLEKARAEVSLAVSRIALERAGRELQITRKRLSANWGSSTASFERVLGEFESIAKVPPIEYLQEKISQNPALARWKTEMELRRAAVELEEASGIPDLTVNVGAQRFEDASDFAFIAGLSISIPIFNRNQGGVLEAKYRVAKASQERRAAETGIHSALGQAHQLLSSSYLEVFSLKNDVLPSARRVFEASREGYSQGKFGYLELLDAQQTFVQVQIQTIEALTTYHKAVADVEQLIAQPLDAAAANDRNVYPQGVKTDEQQEEE